MMGFDPKDYYFRQAKKQRYPARSVFKLQEVQKRYGILKKGQKVLDLGAAPGSWSKYAAEKIGDQGRVLGMDLKEIPLTLPNAYFIQGDLRQMNWEAAFEEAEIHPPFDLVLSDMAPRTSGIPVKDQARSIELAELALESAQAFLKAQKGHFVVKVLEGEDFEAFQKKMRESFQKLKRLRPQSTRQESREIFCIGLNFKG